MIANATRANLFAHDPAMPAEFSLKRRIVFHETDLAGVVHFSNYFRMMEEVEHAFFRSLGMSVVMVHEAMEIGWPRVSASCEYFGPLRFEDEVELRLRVTKVGDKSFNYDVEFLWEGRRVALGKMTSVCCEMLDGTMRSIPIPPGIRRKLEADPA